MIVDDIDCRIFICDELTTSYVPGRKNLDTKIFQIISIMNKHVNMQIN